jgi:hypothetical protein
MFHNHSDPHEVDREALKQENDLPFPIDIKAFLGDIDEQIEYCERKIDFHKTFVEKYEELIKDLRKEKKLLQEGCG